MLYFCADDYGISPACNSRIEECLKVGVLNKVSVLPNGDLTDFKQRLSSANATISLHINLVEGYPLSKPQDVKLLVSKDGNFKYSFIGLLFHSVFGKRKELEEQLYKEIKNQIAFWKKNIGDGALISVDGHQHTHMIPLVFKTLLRVIEDEKLAVENIRIPAEPIMPYILTPSLYASYSVSGIVKQWLLKFLAWINKRTLRKKKIDYSLFIGAMFSGKVTEESLEKLLPKYLKIAKKQGRDIEIALHPGYVDTNDSLIDGCRSGFKKFYFSPWRKREYDTLMNFKYESINERRI